MAISKLKSDELYKKCDPHKFEFTTTAELEERLSALGQDRALSAVELGINIKSKGYNLFCLGPEGTGKTSLVKRILVKEAKSVQPRRTGFTFTILKNRTNLLPYPSPPATLPNLPRTLTNSSKNFRLPFRPCWTATNIRRL